MIYELRTYTMKPGTAPQAAANAGTIGRGIRGDNYGKLEGYWVTEVGPLNQVMHMWSYSDLNERARMRGEMLSNERWHKEYLPVLRPLLLRQDVRLLNCIVAPKAPPGTNNLYEFRNYRLRPGAMKEWVANFTGILPTREKYSPIVGLWSTEAGQPNEVCHIWAYPSFEVRAKVRGQVAEDPEWQAFLGKGSGLIEEMHSTLMLPAAHSPLQ